jgi:hypothetical protein
MGADWDAAMAAEQSGIGRENGQRRAGAAFAPSVFVAMSGLQTETAGLMLAMRKTTWRLMAAARPVPDRRAGRARRVLEKSGPDPRSILVIAIIAAAAVPGKVIYGAGLYGGRCRSRRTMDISQRAMKPAILPA